MTSQNTGKETNPAFLRRLAQDDYMIDSHYLPDGTRLLALADAMESAASRSGHGVPPMLRFIVSYGGGLGPHVWDAELTVEARSVREALDMAEPKVLDAGGAIFSIEQES